MTENRHTRSAKQMVLRGAFLQVILGLFIGIPASIVAGHVMAAELFGIGAWNLLALTATTALLGTVALLAAALPAHRAATVDPTQALRAE